MSSHRFGRHAFAHAGPFLGSEPALEVNGRRHPASERRLVSKRWLAGTIVTGVAGASLIGGAIYATLDRHATAIQAPSYGTLGRGEAKNAEAGPAKGDRLVKKVDVIAEKQTFKAPTTVTVGDKQVIRLRGYTHVATTLTVTPTEFADQVPPFNPLRLLSDDQPDPNADVPADPGLAPDVTDVAFTTTDLRQADPADFVPGLTKTEVAGQVSQMAKAQGAIGVRGALALPPQLLLMRTSRAILDAAGPLAFANPADVSRNPFSSIEVRMVPENVTVVPRPENLHEAGLPEDRLVIMRHGDALDDVLRANGATRDDIRSIVNAFGIRRGEAPVSEGRRLRLLMTETDEPRPRLQIARLSVYADETLENTIALDDDGRYVKVEPATAAPKPAVQAGGEDDNEDAGRMRLYDAIYQTALKQQLPKPVIATMIRILANDVDFQQAVQAGDSFDAFYSDDDDGDGRPDLLFASVTVRNDVLRYYRYQPPSDGGAEYYDDNGRSMRKFLIRTPVPTGIFTSGFGMRFHPILGYSRPHTGVDWAAPVGTPIMAAGNGTVLTAERSSSYGNHIEIQHANGYVTTYSHMVGFARGIADGSRVRQGQVIGYLGQTGLATGPHLHYEVIVNGHFVDPMRVRLARSHDVDANQMADFKREHDRIDALITSAPNAPQGPQKRASR